MENIRESTQIDSWPWKKKAVAKVIGKKTVPECAETQGQSIRAYNMNHKNRGVALILNHYKFRIKCDRSGTQEDKKSIMARLADLQFEIRDYDDLFVQDIIGIVKKLAREDHSENDCLVVVVMSHGNNMDQVEAYDTSYNLYTIIDILNSCPTLQGKPKIYFIQACRGDEADFGAQKSLYSNTSPVPTTKSYPDRKPINQLEKMRSSYVVPSTADTLIMRSTYEGFVSWRNPDEGSWFIQSLCKELQKTDPSQDLLTILTFVNRHVALDYESNVSSDPTMDKKKQICTILSTLRRLVYFPSRY